MPNYANGKIYQIISPNHPEPYIGSTTQPLCKRMVGHRCLKHKCTSRLVIEAGDAYIELIEDYPCENKEQLNRREGEIIRSRKCVNQRVAGRTLKETRQAYREHNHEALSAKNKEYREGNREAISAQQKTYYQTNREAIISKKRAKYAIKKAKSEATESPVISEISQPS